MNFTVPAIPIAQPRPRAVAVAGRARVYGAKKSHAIHDYKASVRQAFAAAGGVMLEGPLSVAVVFLMPRPQSMVWKTKPMPREVHAKKPDIDNLVKGTLDSLSGVAWRDDGQVASLTAIKFVCGGAEQPRVEISIATGAHDEKR